MTIQSNIKTASAVNNLKQAGRDAKDAANSEVNDYSSRLTDVANKVGGEVGAYVDQATDYFNDATARIKTTGRQIETQIEANPLRSSIIALSAGVILGLLLRK
jgi:ElaB/YqjD/DUF883 family membrane-anchored ribosome-binding protein